MKADTSRYERVVNTLVAFGVVLTLAACRSERPTAVPQPTPISSPTPPWKTPTPLPHAPTVAVPTRTPEPTRTPTPTAIPESQVMDALVNVSSELAGRCVRPNRDAVYQTTLDMRADIGNIEPMIVHTNTYARVLDVKDTGEVVLELSFDDGYAEAFVVPPNAVVYGYEPLVANIDGKKYSTEFRYGLFGYTGRDKDGKACFVPAPNPDDYIQPPQDGPQDTMPQLPASTHQL